MLLSLTITSQIQFCLRLTPSLIRIETIQIILSRDSVVRQLRLNWFKLWSFAKLLVSKMAWRSGLWIWLPLPLFRIWCHFLAKIEFSLDLDFQFCANLLDRDYPHFSKK